MKNLFKIPVGLSDHYPGIDMSVMSLGLGADIIERHLQLIKTLKDQIIFYLSKQMK